MSSKNTSPRHSSPPSSPRSPKRRRLDKSCRSDAYSAYSSPIDADDGSYGGETRPLTIDTHSAGHTTDDGQVREQGRREYSGSSGAVEAQDEQTDYEEDHDYPYVSDRDAASQSRSMSRPSDEHPEDEADNRSETSISNNVSPISRTRSPSPIPTRPMHLNYKLKATLRGHKRGVAAVRYSPDGHWIASCSADASIRIFNAHTYAHTETLEGHLAGISCISWSPDSKTLASGSDDKTIRLWDITTGRCHPTPLRGHHNYIYSIAFSPKGNILASGSYDEAVFLWDVRSAHVMRSLPAHSDPVGGVDFVRDGTLVVSCGGGDGLIRLWDPYTGQCLRTLVHEDNAPVTSVRFSPNGRYVLAHTLDSCVRLWNYVQGRCVKTYQGHKNVKYSIGGAFGRYGANRDVGFAVSGSEDGTIVLWDVCSKRMLQRLEGHRDVVLGVDCHPFERQMVSCGTDGTVRVWEEVEEEEQDCEIEATRERAREDVEMDDM